MKKISTSAALIFFLLTATQIYSAQKSEIIIVVDQSRSIREAMPAIKDYVRDQVFHVIAHPGDRIHLLSFDGQFYEIGTLPAESDPKSIDVLLDKVQPIGGYTDLTNAVIEMTKYSIANSDSKTNKIVFFMTDGLNEPPAFSPYRDGLKDSYFTNAREYYQGKGWTVFVSGIGEKTNAPELAEILQAEYIQLSAKPTPEEFNLVVSEKLEKARKQNPIPYLPIGIASALLIAGGSSSLLILRKRA